MPLCERFHCAGASVFMRARCVWVRSACCLCRSFKACQNSTQVEGQAGCREGGSVSGVWCWWALVRWSGCLSTNDSPACFHTQSRQLLWNININEAHGRKHTSHTLFFFFFFKWKFFISCFVLIYWQLSLTSIKLSTPFFFCVDFSQGELKENSGVTAFDEVGLVTASQNRSLLV